MRQEYRWRKDLGLATLHPEGALDTLWEAQLVLTSDPVLAWGNLESSRLKQMGIWECVHPAAVPSGGRGTQPSSCHPKLAEPHSVSVQEGSLHACCISVRPSRQPATNGAQAIDNSWALVVKRSPSPSRFPPCAVPLLAYYTAAKVMVSCKGP